MPAKQPVKTFSVKAIEASVWLNADPRGNGSRFEITVARRYQSRGTWHRTTRFFIDDLPRVQFLLGEAYRFVAMRTYQPGSGDGREGSADSGEGGRARSRPRET